MQGNLSSAPAPRSRAAPAVPTKWAHIIAEMDRLGLTYRLEAQFDLDLIDLDNRRVQVRESEHVAPKERVAQYAVMMGQSEYPPIIVTKDGLPWSVDGNTRVQAKRKRNERFFPAFVLDIEYDTASAHQRRLLTILGSTLNASNGQPMTLAERVKSVEAMIAEGWRVEQIARALGIKSSHVNSIKRELEARARLQRVNAQMNDRVTLTAIRAFGAGEVLALNDAPYRELASLANDAGLQSAEIRELARKMRETGSDEGALMVVNDARAEMHERIIQHSLTGHGRPPESAKLRVSLAFAIGHADNEGVLVEHNPDNVELHIGALDKAIAVLQRVKELQLS